MQFSNSILAALVVASASAHCLISTATGDLGGNATGLGVVDITKQSSVTQFSRNKQETGFGRTDKGPLQPNTLIAAMQQKSGSTLPQVAASGGVVTMTIRQLNGDGAGPMNCSVSADASGKTFTTMTITKQVPGKQGQSQANNKDFPLVAEMPDGVACTGTVGGQENVCMVKCQNPNVFGSVIPVQMSSKAAGSSTIQATSADETKSAQEDVAEKKAAGGNTAQSKPNDKKGKAQQRAVVITRHHKALQIAARHDDAAEGKTKPKNKNDKSRRNMVLAARENMELTTPRVRGFMAEIKAFFLTPRGICCR